MENQALVFSFQDTQESYEFKNGLSFIKSKKFLIF